MEKLYNNLLILNYGRRFCRKYGINPINKDYFLQNFNSGEQYFIFVSLSTWIIKHLDHSYKISMPKDSDDPNLTISNILRFLSKNIGENDYSINKLKCGFGEQVILLLNTLINMWMNKQVIEWNEMSFNISNEHKNDIIVDEEDKPRLSYSSTSPNDSENDEDHIEIDKGNLKENHTKYNSEFSNGHMHNEEEFDSVLPDLKTFSITFINPNGTHSVEQLQGLYKNINVLFANIEHSISTLLTKHSNSIDTLREKEKKLNTNVETNFVGVQEQSQKLKALNEELNMEKDKVKKRSETFDRLNLDVEKIRNEIKRRVDGMTDTSELEKSKRLLARLHEEIFDINIKIKFLSTILQR